MNHPNAGRSRVYFTLLVLLAEACHLGWEFFNGGVRSHHLLASPDLPEFSNWWGIVWLPALTWFAVGRVRHRTASEASSAGLAKRLSMASAVGFVGALLVGSALSLTYFFDYSAAPSYIFFGVIAVALFLPVFRVECLLGFILGMTFTFGAVLPTIIGSLIAALSALSYFGVRPVFRWVFNLFRGRRVAT